jgi:hypothetical protein
MFMSWKNFTITELVYFVLRPELYITRGYNFSDTVNVFVFR